ncbi:MAG: 3-hydroxyacyl-CoA dehydrogenase, partial [Thermoplasmata archaeon]|nr:3-hydroxyacyl-CoA dehydrogenase [Thermoplasmata archaeon]
NEEVLKKAVDSISWSLGKFAEKKTIREEDAKAALARIKTNVDLEAAVADADLVVEAVPEKLELKKSIFKRLDGAAPAHAILASNTSSLSITEMAAQTDRADKVIGMHFFSPPVLMALVEVVRGERTSDETTDTIVDLVKKLGKTPVVVRKDVRGFIVNRVLGAVMNEAFSVVEKGEATMEEVDAAVKYKAGFPLGAFELADMVGLDVMYEVGKIMEGAYGDVAKSSPMVEKLVKEGHLGQKTGKGFYDWKVGRPRISFRLAGKFDVNRLYSIATNETARLIHEDVAEPEDIDTAMKLGTGWPMGPCEQSDKMGLDKLLEKLKELHAKYGEEMYRPSPLLEEYVAKGWTGKAAGRGFYQYE